MISVQDGKFMCFANEHKLFFYLEDCNLGWNKIQEIFSFSKSQFQFLVPNYLTVFSRSGHCFILRDIHIFRLLKSLRYTSMRSLQPMRKAQSSLVEYQTDSRPNWAGTWRREWSTRLRTTNSPYWARVSTYAETAKRVHTSPSGHKTVWTHFKYVFWI